MSSENGTGMPSLIVYECKSGVVCHITPINIATLSAILIHIQDILPFPDKAAYALPLEGSFVSEEVKKQAELDAAESNPEYIKACDDVRSERLKLENNAILDLSVRFLKEFNSEEKPIYYTPEELIERFALPLSKLRKYADLPDSDYEAVIWYLVFSGNTLRRRPDNAKLEAVNGDFAYIKELAIQQIPLSHAEVMAGIRYFRYSLPGAKA